MPAPAQTTFHYANHIWYFYLTDDKERNWQVMRTFARAGLADQTTDRSGGQSFLSRPAVVCACCLGFSSGSPLSGGAGLGSFSSIAVKYSGYDG
jgi:hypothetical protein